MRWPCRVGRTRWQELGESALVPSWCQAVLPTEYRQHDHLIIVTPATDRDFLFEMALELGVSPHRRGEKGRYRHQAGGSAVSRGGRLRKGVAMIS